MAVMGFASGNVPVRGQMETASLRMIRDGIGRTSLRKLETLLKKLPRERRRQVLSQCFTEGQRRALEEEILEARSCPGSLKRLKDHSAKHSDNSQKRPAETRGIVVHRRGQQKLYSAVTLFERLELRTREVVEVEKATSFRNALRELKAQLSNEVQGSASDGPQATDDTLLSATAKVLANFAHHSDLGLYLRVSTPARRWVGGTLWGPCFRVSQLEKGLQGWAEMRAAQGGSGDAWARIRQAYFSLWESAGRSLEDVQRKLDTLERRKAQQKAERENAHALRAEAEVMRLLSSWTQRVIRTSMRRPKQKARRLSRV